MKDNFSLLHERVKVYNKINQKKLSYLLNISDLLICTSRHETLHLAGIEAMFCNIPVVASDVGIYSEIKKTRHAEPRGISFLHDQEITSRAKDLCSFGCLCDEGPRIAIRFLRYIGLRGMWSAFYVAVTSWPGQNPFPLWPLCPWWTDLARLIGEGAGFRVMGKSEISYWSWKNRKDFFRIDVKLHIALAEVALNPRCSPPTPDGPREYPRQMAPGFLERWKYHEVKLRGFVLYRDCCRAWKGERNSLTRTWSYSVILLV